MFEADDQVLGTHLESGQLNDNLLKAVLDISSESMFLLQKSNNSILDCNQSALELFEAQNKSQLINLPSFRLYDYEPNQFHSDKIDEAIANNGIYTQELAFRTLKQNSFWGRMTQKVVNDNLILLKVKKTTNYLNGDRTLSEFLDATSKVTGLQFFKEVCLRFMRLFNSEFAFIAKLDSEQFGKLSSIEYQSVSGFEFPAEIEYKSTCFENVLKGNISYYPKDLQGLFPKDKCSQKLNAESFIGAPMFGATGQVIGVLGVLDCKPMEEYAYSRQLLSIFASRSSAELQRLKAKELLRQQTRDLANANSMKDELLRVIAHDLQAPLHTVLNFSKMLKDNLGGYSLAQITQKIEVMDHSIQNLYHLLENITDWSKVQRERLRCNPEPIMLRSCIESTIDSSSYFLNIRSIGFKLEMEKEVQVLGDRRMVDAVLRNVLSYITKYAEQESEIQMQVSKHLEKAVVQIVVNEKGFDLQELQEFLSDTPEHFYEATTDRNLPALGLFLCHEYLGLHDSKIWYEQDNGKLKVYLELPLADKSIL